MEINRIYKPKRFDNFTIVPNAVFRIKGISLGATGLYAYLFSHDTDKPITIKFIQGHFKESYKAIKSRLEELEKLNLLTRERVRYNGQYAGFNYYLNDTSVQNGNCQKGKKNNNNYTNKYDENSIAYKSLEHFIKLFPTKYQPKNNADKYKWYETLEKIERIDGYDIKDVFKICNVLRSDRFWSDNFLSLRKLRNKDKNGIRYIDRFMDTYNKVIKPKCYYKIKGIQKYYLYNEDNQEKLGAVTETSTLNELNLVNVFNNVEMEIMKKYAKHNS